MLLQVHYKLFGPKTKRYAPIQIQLSKYAQATVLRPSNSNVELIISNVFINVYDTSVL